eukprot:INCI12262.1.p2 GENE.INCI12262.1~~INCI12262.1.p2  ORF type:complete len:317 (-),score=77.20 INCI12262.1:1248-2198(-)
MPKGGGGGGGKAGGGKRKFNHSDKYNHNTKRSRLGFAAGSAGIMVTCHSMHERSAASEALNILEETYDKLFPEQPNEKGDSATKPTATKKPLTVAEELALEAAEMKTEKKKKSRFSSIPTGCRGILLFLLPRKKPAADAADLVDASKATNSAPLSAAGTLVSQLVQEIQRDVHAQKQSKSRHCERMVPLQTICTAKIDDVVAASASLFESFMNARPELKKTGIKFAIRIKVRHNDKLKRKEVIDRVAKLFEAPHSVDLSNPEALFVVECVRSVCGLSIVPTDRLESNTFSIKFAANDASNAAPVAAETTDSSTTAR